MMDREKGGGRERRAIIGGRLHGLKDEGRAKSRWAEEGWVTAGAAAGRLGGCGWVGRGSVDGLVTECDA